MIAPILAMVDNCVNSLFADLVSVSMEVDVLSRMANRSVIVVTRVL